MADYKISGMIISLILVSLLAFIFLSVFGELGDRYSPSTDVDNETLLIYDQLEELNNETERYENLTLSVGSGSGFTDILGAIFTSGYSALKQIFGSVIFLKNIVQYALFENLGLGIYTNAVKQSLLSIILVIVFIGIGLSIIIKRDL